jgi:cell division protein FtsB
VKKINKKTVLRQLFILEILIFIGVYFFGNDGYRRISEIDEENQKLCMEVFVLKGEIEKIEKEIQEWQATDFYKEKFARERLQMAKQGDEIYFIK